MIAAASIAGHCAAPEGDREPITYDTLDFLMALGERFRHDRAVPAVELARMGRELVAALREHGVLPPRTDLDLADRTLTVVGGFVSQQLANAPDEPSETGTFTSTLPDVVAMWLAHQGGPRVRPSSWKRVLR